MASEPLGALIDDVSVAFARLHAVLNSSNKLTAATVKIRFN
jgi:hypothetical protein